MIDDTQQSDQTCPDEPSGREGGKRFFLSLERGVGGKGGLGHGNLKNNTHVFHVS